ncbi:peroxide stress protein YaaA [Campylobacter hepaticus]|uniref:Peroxide stress protein YaaA n=1 Tax=Campylobacter hepaticus TaxID=1813019 RepID=A0A424Z0C2_9BACT|nr:peroxide stress protein YaaA [Campylobacter hepaticus]AXP08512.1 peroxide stress protein YaaA [Campylobacter hepaticus]MCZ0772348.1 peroxide stress protein YaaA [Campylobacter hepaticus]MCZ0773816.1 peroxide stress protein YaaA [Campylobacter hepaticus]MCZ0775067.1 peroxide stress protein YaaA [Campylobacter hepaticus]MDX2322936.1 peroxide stress protein YaaA [Campylobacter hepaticus]
MNILFSPSENKNDNCNEKAIHKNSFIFKELFDFRMQALKKYEDHIKEASLEDLQELFGIKNEKEILKFKQNLKTAPTQKAITLYNGVSYEYLNFKTLDQKSQNYILNNTLIFSNLFGVVKASDHLPFYKYKQGVKLKNFAIEKFYKEHFSKNLDEYLKDKELLDLRAEFYNKFYTPKQKFSTYKFIKKGKVVSHFAKAYRGILLAISAKIQAKNNQELLKNLPSNLKLKEIQIKGLKEEFILEILD